MSTKRYEIKIPISNHNKILFLNWFYKLKSLNEIHNKRQINNIYYDTDEFICAQRNIDGITNRTKFRLRWYNNNISNCYLELKIKNGRIGFKIINPIDEQIDQINIKNFLNIKNMIDINIKDQILKEILKFRPLKPVLRLQYDRSYFLYEKNIRITIDEGIKYCSPHNLLKSNFSIEDNLEVVEIKFDTDYLDQARQLISKMPFTPKRHSKYLRGLSLSGKAIYI